MGICCSKKTDDITFFEKCSICHESLIIQDVKPFKCSHSIHSYCNRTFIKYPSCYRCPLCRASPKKRRNILKNKFQIFFYKTLRKIKFTYF